VLLTHLTLYTYVYPGEQDRIPEWVFQSLIARLQNEVLVAPRNGRLCRGPLLAGSQYIIDTERWGFKDARLPPYGTMTPVQIDEWLEGIRAGK
jgi:hypothetical protein